MMKERIGLRLNQTADGPFGWTSAVFLCLRFVYVQVGNVRFPKADPYSLLPIG